LLNESAPGSDAGLCLVEGSSRWLRLGTIRHNML
jgi:hypothetical protein